MGCQDGAPIGEGLQVGVGHHVLVIGSVGMPHGSVGIVTDDRVSIAGVNPEREPGPQQVVKRRLAPLLMPGHLRYQITDRQPVPIGHVLNVLVVPHLIRRFEEGIDETVGCAQAEEGHQNEQDGRVLTQKARSLHRSTLSRGLQLVRGSVHLRRLPPAGLLVASSLRAASVPAS